MRGLRSVFVVERKLLVRSRGIWLMLPVVAFFGVWAASMAREVPFVFWSQFTIAELFVTLMLTLATGGQIARDAERRVAGVLLSTPISSAAYTVGKYLAALAVLLALSVAMLAGAVAMDHFDTWRDPPAVLGHSMYPSLGPWPYVSAWLWLVLVPVIFGAALALAAITWLGGQRVVSSMGAVLLWLIPAFLASSFSGGIASLLDVAGMTLYGSVGVPSLPPPLAQLYLTGAPPSPALAAEMIRAVVAQLPPDLPMAFYWNRALFVALAVVLVAATSVKVARERRGA